MSYEWNYLPILKWKRGEQFALRNLTNAQWIRLSPLVELQSIDSPPDGAALRSSLQEFLKSKVGNEVVKSVPDDRFVFVDTSNLFPGYARQGTLLVAVCEYLQRNFSRRILPSVHPAALESLSVLTATQLEFLKAQEAVLLRLRSDQIESSQVGPSIDELAAIGIKKKNIHVLIDQQSLLDRKPAACLASVKPYLDPAFAAKCASVTIGGGSFPMFLMGIRQGITDIPRVEWKVWEFLRASRSYHGLRYADYTVTNPAPLPYIDGKVVNPAIAIRYAANGFWRLFKGRGFKSGVSGEYRNLCKLLTKDPIYSGEDFSYGDNRYFLAASGGDKNGIPMTWRRDATSHHIVFTSTAL